MRNLLVAAEVFLSGGAVMVVELLGVRLISPYYGTGMVAWASLISVALAALALGYAVGGRLADRKPSRRVFHQVVVVSGLGITAIPLYAPALIPLFEGAGLRLGALLAATVTFLPPLFLLGVVSPFAVRITARALEGVGGTAGRIYAIATVGSVAGTLAAGFLLEPLLRINTTLTAVGVLVGSAGLAGLLVRPSPGTALPPVLLAALALLPAARGAAPPGRLLFRADSPYQRVEVLDRGGERWLLLDGCVHSHLDLSGGSPRVAWGYPRLFAILPGFRPRARRLLLLGLGAGAAFPLLDPEGYEVTVVEIDPVVVEAARRWFGTIPEGLPVRVEDARAFVRRTRERFDLVLLDVCGSDRMPEHLATVECFREIARILTPEGLLAVNAIGARKGRGLAALRRTLGAVFPHVRAFATHPEAEITNVVYCASLRPLPMPWAFESEFAPREVDLPGGALLEDQWNPFNAWNAPWARRIRSTRRERYGR